MNAWPSMGVFALKARDEALSCAFSAWVSIWSRSPWALPKAMLSEPFGLAR